VSRPPDVEFLVPDRGDGADEELPTPDRKPHSRVVRIAIAAAVLAVGVAAVRGAIDRSAAPTGAAVATTTVGPASASATAPTPGFPSRDRFQPLIPRLISPTPCTAQPGCRAVRTLPLAFRAAVRAQFPGTTTVTAVSRVGSQDHQLWSREYTGRFGVIVLHVVVSPGGIRGSTTSFDDGIWVRAASWCRSGSAAIQVFASAPSGHDPTLAKLARLCVDPRLLAPD
jgi:hypothetical protein